MLEAGHAIIKQSITHSIKNYTCDIKKNSYEIFFEKISSARLAKKKILIHLKVHFLRFIPHNLNRKKK